MTDIFISYKREDKRYAKIIAEYLVYEGYEVWWDIELLPGDRFADEINEVLSKAKLIIVLWTPEATASDWVKAEATIGFKRNNLIPIMLRKAEIPVPFNTLQTLDFTGWDGEGSPREVAALLKQLIAKRELALPQHKIESKEELQKVLDKPEHEVEFWTSIANAESQRVEEYQLYLETFGESGSFAKLAHRRISVLTQEPKKSTKTKESLTIISIIMGIAVGGFTIANFLGAFERGEPGPMPTKTKLVCSYIDIKKLGWSSGHKTNFCIAHGYEQGNFNQGEYNNGGICMKGPQPDVCKAAYTGRLGDNIECHSEGSLVKCYVKNGDT